MNLFTKKKRSKIISVLTAVILFIIAAFFFVIYFINLSSLILIVVLALYLKYFCKKSSLPSSLDLFTLVVLAVLIVVLTTITFKLSPYAVSAIGFSILITVLFGDLQLSILFSTVISLMAASTQTGSFGVIIGISLLASSIAAAMMSYRVRVRSMIIRAGFFAGLLQFIVAFIGERGQGFYFFSYPDIELLKVCLINGIVSAVVVIGVLPVFEYIFRVVTNVSLLELSDFNNPLLKKMILEAPGTYHHSLVVANLAEAATEAIGANSLLARVGAYYHDVGKTSKPHYFVENQIPYRDIHKDLKPSISKLIIINHVKEGVELAKKYHLNPKIIDFIVQHHGRSLVYYFYHRAKELEPKAGNEEEYRYPGPKPQSKEIAIVSLADTIEALSRTLEEPTPSRIEEMVNDVVRKKFIEGELDESELTLKDLEKVTESFTRVLNATFHTRIVYPQDDTDKKSSKNQENKPG